jgi:hypothetical protein
MVVRADIFLQKESDDLAVGSHDLLGQYTGEIRIIPAENIVNPLRSCDAVVVADERQDAGALAALYNGFQRDRGVRRVTGTEVHVEPDALTVNVVFERRIFQQGYRS